MILQHPADTRRLRMTIGWIEEWVNDGRVRDGLRFDSDEISNATVDEHAP